MTLSNDEKKFLLNIARQSLELWIAHKGIYKPSLATFNGDTTNLASLCGAFVTLHKNGQLRGCIGRFEADYSSPLYLLVNGLTIDAATHDHRFQPVQANEAKNIEIEISVLTPRIRINSIDEIVLGKHGIYIQYYGRTSTFLPQVATETGWNKEQFLGNCMVEKMGLGWNDWRSAAIFTYEAIVFNEAQMK
jgi:AmmeMemoRadiSam system protein A